MTKTENRIIAILRRQSSTIADLVEALDLSRNAIVFQLSQMEAKGLITKGSARHEKRAGKPSIEYVAVSGQEDSMSNAYRNFASLLVEQVSQQLPPKAMKKVMRQIGLEIAKSSAIDKDWPVSQRLTAARAVADELGAATELSEVGGKYIIESHNCPLASAVRSDACVCTVVESFFKEATGCLVEQHCNRDDKLLCRFELTPRL